MCTVYLGFFLNIAQVMKPSEHYARVLPFRLYVNGVFIFTNCPFLLFISYF